MFIVNNDGNANCYDFEQKERLESGPWTIGQQCIYDDGCLIIEAQAVLIIGCAIKA